MCVGLPAKVMDTHDGVAVIIADLAPGDYVMVHAGMAIAKITGDDETQAEDIMDELEDLLS